MRVPYRKPGKYSQIKPDPFITEGKFVELKDKLDKLKNLSRPKAIEEVKRLAELGDFSENAEYQIAKGRLRWINDSIVKIENQLKNAEVITAQKQTDTIQLGHRVTIENINPAPGQSRQKKTYQILGSSETNPREGIISHNSPLGSALVGRKAGKTVKIKIGDREAAYKIIRVE